MDQNTEQEIVTPETDNKIMELKPEATLIYACYDDEMSKDIERIAEEHKMVAIHLENALIDDYVTKLKADEENKATTVDELLANEQYRVGVQNQALTLWNILSNNGDIQYSGTRTFTKAVVKKVVKITNKELDGVLDIMKLFGFIRFTQGTYEFAFIFNEDTQRRVVHADVLMSLQAVKENITRYENLYLADGEKSKAIEDLRAEILRTLNISPEK